MNKKQIRFRRWKHNVAPERILKIVRKVKSHHVILFTPPIHSFSYWERVKSLFNFKAAPVAPTHVRVNNRTFAVSQHHYGE